jgi:hypothetical protein
VAGALDSDTVISDVVTANRRPRAEIIEIAEIAEIA